MKSKRTLIPALLVVLLTATACVASGGSVTGPDAKLPPSDSTWVTLQH